MALRFPPSGNYPVPENALVVGTDLITIGEVTEAIRRFGDRYLKRVFTDAELGYCRQVPDRAGERLAARFAAKEATMKVLRVGDTDAIDWRSIEVHRDEDGWCDIVLHGSASVMAERNGITGFALSMSHAGDYATATVVAHRRSA